MGQSKKDYEKTLPVLQKREFEKELQFLAFKIEKSNKPLETNKKK